MKVSESFTELSIRLAVIEAKVDKLIDLAMRPEIEYEIVQKVEVSDDEYFGEVYK